MKSKLNVIIAVLFFVSGMLLFSSCETTGSRTGSSATDSSAATTGTARSSDEDLVEEDASRAERVAAMNAFINEDVLFDYDKATLKPEAQEILRSKADWLIKNADASIVIEGHCDERGSTEYNLALGDRRAQSVRMFLMDLGVPRSRMSKISYGEEMPVDRRHNEAAWAKNRRAHFNLE